MCGRNTSPASSRAVFSVAAANSAALSRPGVAFGSAAKNAAAAPAAVAAACDVPLSSQYASSPGWSHRPAPPHALRTLAPGAHASKHGPVELHGYASSFGPVAATVSADASRAGLSPQQLARLAFPAAATTSAPLRVASASTARSSARDDSPAETPSARRTIAGGSPAASCVAAIHWRPRTTSETYPAPAQSSTRTGYTAAPGATPTVRPATSAATCVPWPSQSEWLSGFEESGERASKPARTRGPSGFASNSRCVARTPVSTTYTRTPSPAAREGATPSRGSARWSRRSRCHGGREGGRSREGSGGGEGGRSPRTPTRASGSTRSTRSEAPRHLRAYASSSRVRAAANPETSEPPYTSRHAPLARRRHAHSRGAESVVAVDRRGALSASHKDVDAFPSPTPSRRSTTNERRASASETNANARVTNASAVAAVTVARRRRSMSPPDVSPPFPPTRARLRVLDGPPRVPPTTRATRREYVGGTNTTRYWY